MNLIADFDVHYQNDSATAACVTFQNWTDSAPVAEYIFDVCPIEPYHSGIFYERELPCLVALIERYNLQPQIIVVDGYVWLDENKIGLGGHLYKYLGG